MSKRIVALGNHVVLKAVAKSAGREQVTQSGFILPPTEKSEMPTHCVIHDIGASVPEGMFKIGDMTPFPLGEKLNVPHPDVISGICKPDERDDKYMSTHYSNISCVYE
ncbi:head morphogenesis [Acinetobacter phage Acj9]|uniref:Gp31 head assembly cochaperone with GroEL n=1 Tax=Acinetobacter phage Acj9 TaxID=760939 RepID=E5EPZ6_9CAUD|nr:head morphogenesis [Acinetobacter phage Acj9]ADG60112.1 gp31 head assembly cochaperone with GroEL [Acinetobacter phage Acj9]